MRQVLTAPLVDNALSFIAPRYFALLNNHARVARCNAEERPKKADNKGNAASIILPFHLFRQLFVERRCMPLVIEARDSLREVRGKEFLTNEYCAGLNYCCLVLIVVIITIVITFFKAPF